MSWASRKRSLYLSVIFGVLAIVVAVPLSIWLYDPATCFDNEMNQGETAVDRGGPCRLLDERSLMPHAVLWTRAFQVRDGTYTAVAYIENPNASAAVMRAPYRMRFYDDRNVPVAEREGVTYIMPGTITPVFEGQIDSGERSISRTFFEFAGPLTWEQGSDASNDIQIENKQISAGEAPRVTADAYNTSIKRIEDIRFVAVAFDSTGNAFAASQTALAALEADDRQQIVFTWPSPFIRNPARVDITAILPPRQ